MTKKDKTIYQDDSIQHIEGREFTRLRPATYLGSNEYSTQLVREVFANALDEYLIGHGNSINVNIDTKKNIYQVIDFGQGFPINTPSNVEGETVLQASFDQINTSGKYSDDGVYGGSVLGLNGIGAKLTNFLSKELTVYSSNGKGTEQIIFKDGLFQSREVTDNKTTTGTIVTWTPDKQFFQNVEANKNDLEKLFEDISALCPNLLIIFNWNGQVINYQSTNGIQDLVDKKFKIKEILSNRFCVHKVKDNSLFDICMTYTSDYSDNIIAYVNYGLTESGIHISLIKSLMTKEINKYARDNNLLKKNEDNITSSELSEGLVIVFNLKAQKVKYDSQTKVRVVDVDRSLINQVISNDFPVWLKNNSKDTKLIIERALLARKARDAAQKAKDKIREVKNNKKFISLPTKLVDAYSKDRSECELYITEGDSAANGLIAKRDGKTQAIFPIRGKILSCRKATMSEVYDNQELSNIVKALGLDIDKNTGKLIYDIKKLRYNKIIFATDADPDGYNIRLLLINAFWWLCPDLIMNGHIYAAIPPLYKITTSKNDYLYLITDNDLETYKKTNKNFKINRLKGLGEQSPNELAECILYSNTRNVHQLKPASYEEIDNMLELFMGKDVPPRRKYLLEHCNEVEVDYQ